MATDSEWWMVYYPSGDEWFLANRSEMALYGGTNGWFTPVRPAEDWEVNRHEARKVMERIERRGGY